MTWTVFTTLVAVTTAADLITKAIAFKNLGMPGTSPGWPVIPNMLWYRTSLNEGALFGLGQGMGWFFITVSVAAIIGIVFTVSWLRIQNDTVLIVALASITGGILGNLYDRLGIPGLHWHASGSITTCSLGFLYCTCAALAIPGGTCGSHWSS